MPFFLSLNVGQAILKVGVIMTRPELYEDIAVEMLDNELLNENNYSTVNDLLKDVMSIISGKLNNYTIVNGNVLQ